MSLWVLLSVFHALGQSDYERAVRLFDEADSIRYAEDNRLEKDHDNYRLAIQKFEEARDLFNGVDSTYFGFRSEVGIFKCQLITKELEIHRIRKVKKELLGIAINGPLLAQAYYHEGAYLLERNEYNTAILAFHYASQIFGEQNATINSVNANWYLGYTYGKIADYDLQFSYYQKSLALLAKMPINHYRVRSEYSLNRNSYKYHIMKGRVNKFWEAFFYCQKLLNDYPNSFKSKDHARLYIEAGRQLRNMGLSEKALEFFAESKEHLNLIWSRNLNESLTYTQLGDNTRAIEILTKLLSVNLTPTRRAITMNNLGSNLMEVGNLNEAKFHFDSAMKINHELGRNIGMAICLGNMAEIFLKQEEPELAKTYIEKSYGYFPKYSDELSHLLSLYYYQIGNIDSAFYFSKQSVLDKNGDIFLDYTVPSSITELVKRSKWLLEIIESSLRQGIHKNGAETLDLYSKFHSFFGVYSFGYDQFDFTESSGFIYEQGIRHSLLLNQTYDHTEFLNRAFQFSEWSKVHSLQRAKKTSQAKFLAGLPEALIDKERSLKIDENYFRSQLSSFSNVEVPDSSRLARYHKRLSEITESQDSLENIIRINYPRYHQLQYQDITLSVEEVQDRLNPSQAFVEYYEGDTTSFVFTITKDDYQVKRIHLDDDTLITMYREFFEPEHFQPEQKQVNDLSYQIYQNYLQPALGELDTTISELIVVPDGKLSYVPLDILQTRPAHDKDAEVVPYLLRDYQVHYTYSASLYFNDFSTLSTKNQYLAFAPEYAATLTDTASISRLGNFRNQVTPLKHNQEEVAYISENFKGLGFFGTNANERNFKEKVDEYGVLHLAMHTIVDDEDPMNSKLVFSNSKDSLEDDLLHAFEIYNMEIPSQLAVLSACETGFGQLAKGEGALSLARAFSYAGSPSVVMSHWPVDDQTTATLMKSFYGYLADGLTKSDALRKAKLDFLDQTHSARAHPFFWGSFVVMGDDAPVQIQRLPPFHPIWVVLLCLLVIGSAGFVVNRYGL